MMDFQQARDKMVDCQVRTCDVTNHALLSAMLSVPREEFVPEALKEIAYIDADLPLTDLGATDRYVTEAAPFAQLVQLASVKEDDIILVVGCGTGYSAAVLSVMGASVVALESNEALVNFATEKLSAFGYDNVAVLNDNPKHGCAKEAPFDVIYIDGAVGELPSALLDQLNEGGRLVVVEGEGNSANAKLHTKKNGLICSYEAMNCAIKPLPGFEKVQEFSL